MSLFDRFGASVKAAATSLAADRATPFSPVGGNGLGFYLDTPGGGLRTANGQRARFNDMVLPQGNSVVTSICAAIAQAFTSAPPVLEQRKVTADGISWKRVDHPIIDLLNRPNDGYGANHLWQVSIESQVQRGNGFWRACMNHARTQPVELWFERELQPVYDEYEFVRKYVRRVQGQPYDLQPGANGIVPFRSDYAIHFRYQIDPFNPRWGWTPLHSVLSQLRGDNAVAIFHEALLANSAVASLFVSLKEKPSGDINAQKLESLIETIKRRLTGHGSGGVAGSTLPVDVTKVGFSPEELALDTLVKYFETRICSVLKTPPIILQLLSGLDPTYANQDGAIRDFWNRNIIPLQEDKGSEIEAQLFPLFGLDRTEFRIAWDRSQIQAIQDDMGEAHQIVREDYKAGIPDLYEAANRLNYPATDDMKGIRYTPPAGGTGDGEPVGPVPSTKAASPLIAWSKREIRKQSLVGPEDAEAAIERSSKHLRPYLEAVGDDES